MIEAQCDHRKVIVTLWNGPDLLLKAYPSPDGKKIRIVLPEMVSASQVIGNVDGPVKYIDFTREAK